MFLNIWWLNFRFCARQSCKWHKILENTCNL